MVSKGFSLLSHGEVAVDLRQWRARVALDMVQVPRSAAGSAFGGGPSTGHTAPRAFATACEEHGAFLVLL